MPIYDFRCLKCGQVMSSLVMGYEQPEDLVCEKCGSEDFKKLISRVNYHSSSVDRVSSYTPGARKSDSFYKDSRNIGLNAEKMLKKAGMQPTEKLKNKIERLRTDPGSIFKDNGD